MDATNLANALRRRNELRVEAKTAEAQARSFEGAFQRPQFTVQTPGFNGLPGTTEVNWGDIFGKGVANYMAARSAKKSADAQSEIYNINQDFMNSTLENDPEAMKLYGLAQAGMPGADRALSEHLAPKKQSLAIYTQLAASGMASPELLAELAPQFGVDPEVGNRAAEYARKAKIEDEDRKFNRQRDMIDYRYDRMAGLKAMGSGGGGGGRKSSAGTEKMSTLGNLYEIDGVPANAPELTAGERQQRAKMLNNMDDTIMKGEAQIAKFPDVWEAVSKPGGLGKGQQVAQAMADSNIPFVSGLGMAARNKEAALLHDYANNEVLSRMGQLGGNDSNEELRRMQASVPNAMQNPETMRALLKRFDAWQKKTMEIIKAKRANVQSGKYFDPRATFEDPREVKGPVLEKNYSPQKSGGPAVSPDMQKPKPTKSIDDWLDEQGIK